MTEDATGGEIAEWPHQNSLTDVWEEFLGNEGRIGAPKTVRGLVLNSWQRSLGGGVDPGIMVAPITAQERELITLRERNRELMDSAVEIMRQAFFLNELQSVLFLTDPNGVALDVIGDKRTLSYADTINLVPGSAWSEVVSGSNAVGTALTNQGAVQVHGEEHFCQGFKTWTCTASVVRDPYDGHILGAIDLSGLRNIYDRFHLPLVVSWASHIESRIALRSREMWSKLEETMANRGWQSDTTLLFDASGRLVNRDRGATDVLARHGLAPAGTRTFRVDLAAFGQTAGTPAEAPEWLRPEWIEVVRERGEMIGFSVSLPSPGGGVARGRPHLRQKPADPFTRIIGGSALLADVVDKARRVAPAPIPVLLLGETGVGKELFAQALHEAGPNPKGPFVAINCAAFSRELLAGELFGHVEGAFTGARRGGMIGKIEAADGGTLFLDEIGEMQIDMQPMLLRVLQERQVHRIGEVKPRKVNFRLIAATNRDLAADAKAGRFRQDLYFRMANVTIEVPPLRDRVEDIATLAQHYLAKTLAEYSLPTRRLHPDLLAHLETLPWPGNVRELGARIEAMCFMARGEIIGLDDFEPGLSRRVASAPPPRPEMREDNERRAMRAAIDRCDGNLTAAARVLGIAKSTLYLRLKKYRDQGLWELQ